MTLHVNKPYAWLDTSGGALILQFKIWCSEGYGIDIGTPHEQRTDDDTLLLIYKLKEDAATPDVLSFKLSDTRISIYDSAIHTRVSIVITDADNIITGILTIKPVDCDFSVTGGPPPFRPFMWIEFVNTDHSIVHIAADVPPDSVLTEQEPMNDPDHYIRWVTFTLTEPGAGTFETIHKEHVLHPDNYYYDPVMDNIIVRLIEYDGSGNERKKGSGTVHTSEGDASGND